MIGFGSSSKRLQCLLLSKRIQVVNSITQLGIFQNYLLFTFKSLSSLSSTKNKSLLNAEQDEQKEHSFTVSYLIRKCGFSLDSAESVSKNVRFKNPQKPDKVIKLLRDYGFTNTDICKLVAKHPRLILADAEKTLLPKLEFLVSMGVRRSDIGGIVSSDPALLTRSLEQHLIPTYNILKSILSCDYKVAKAFTSRQGTRINMENLHNNMVINVSLLRKHGVLESIIFYLVTHRISVACIESEKFALAVNKVVEIGFDPWKYTFLEALRVIAQMNQTTWDRKAEVFRRWGLTEDEIWLAFKKTPRCVTYSEKKITGIMDFLVNKMAWKPAVLAKFSSVFALSLEKKIIPRCSVVRVLLSKGLLKEKLSLCSVLHSPEKQFLKSFVIKYQDKIPQLLSIYRGEMSILELGIGFEDAKRSYG